MAEHALFADPINKPHTRQQLPTRRRRAPYYARAVEMVFENGIGKPYYFYVHRSMDDRRAIMARIEVGIFLTSITILRDIFTRRNLHSQPVLWSSR